MPLLLPIWLSFFYFIGLFQIFTNLYTFLKWTYTAFIRPAKNLPNSYGSYALITGSTDGIGKAYAFQLASQGLNLILLSRNPNKLNSVSKEIKQMYPNIDIHTVAVDFSVNDSCHISKEVERAITGLDVGVLVNNVGITYPNAMYFHEVDEDVWMKIVRVNVECTTGVTKAVLNGMVLRGRGVVVNVGSGAGIVVPSHPLYAVYAATKAYIDQFSNSLHVEYKNLGIDVQCQVPLYVMTKMASNAASIKRPSLFVPTAEDYVVAAVRRIGYESRCSPYWAHEVQWFATKFAPNACLDAWRLSIGIQRRDQSLKL